MVYHKVQSYDLNCSYCIYPVNNFCNVSQLLKYVLFAEEKYFVSGADVHRLKLYACFSINNLSLNVPKTNYMAFGNHRIYFDINVRIRSLTSKTNSLES